MKLQSAPIRTLRILIWIVALSTMLWVGLLIYSTATSPTVASLAGRIETFESRLTLYRLIYANSGFITLATVALYAGIYTYLQADHPLWSAIGLVFIPIYGLANLVVYLSQIFVAPRLLVLYHQPQTAALGEALLALILQEWAPSAVAFLNLLAYAVLGIPSLIYGWLLYQHSARLRGGGLLLALSGLLSFAALVGLGMDNPTLSNLALVSGVLYLVGLIWLGIGLRPVKA